MDNLGNLLGRIKVAGLQKKVFISVSKSSIVAEVLKILYKEGFISGFKDCGISYEVYLKYYGEFPIVRRFTRYSTFSKKVYYTVPVLVREFRRSDFVIMSTVYGIITKTMALDLNVGGEVLVKIN